MSWQRELEELDNELAAGRLSAEDYRRRRDDLLAQAAFIGHRQPSTPSSPSSPSSPSTPGSASTPAADDQAAAPSPFPAPFRWDQSPDQSTQVLGRRPAPRSGGPQSPQSPPDSDSTQVVDPGRRGQDAEQTQVIPSAGGRASQAPYGVPPWQLQDQPSSTPPWTGSDLPPVAERSPSWTRQGPEDFEAPGPDHRWMRIAGMVAIAMLLVGLIATAVVYVRQRGGLPSAEPAQTTGQTTAANQGSAPGATTAGRQLPEPPPPLPRPQQAAAALIDPPGKVRGGGGLFDLSKLTAAKLFPQSTVDALADGNMTDGVLKTTTVERSTIGMYALTVKDPKAALHVIDVIGRNNADGGVRPDGTREQRGVKVYATAETAKEHVFRAVYVAYDRAIELEVFGPDRAAVQSLFDDLLAKQLKHAPPTER